jgi:hypothetical protein
MASILERVGALAGTELSRAVDLAHRTFQDRMGSHRHVGRALVETVAEICRNHPNLVGVGAGLLVEQLLVHEKERHDAHAAALAAKEAPPAPIDPFSTLPESAPLDAAQAQVTPWGSEAPFVALDQNDSPEQGGIKNAHLPNHMIKLSDLKPGRVAFEVFGAILVLKLAATGAKMFRHKHQQEIWFAPAAKIRLFSGAIAAYNIAAAVRSPRISAWRNGAIFFFGTDALKPVLKLSRRPLPVR